MKVAYASDLHLEFEPEIIKNTEGADVLVLAGDICMAEAFKKSPKDPTEINKRTSHWAIEAAWYRRFFKEVAEQFPIVLYVTGNHEAYCGEIETHRDIIRNELGQIASNIHLLDQHTVVLNDVWFVGVTLWTDVNRGDPLTEMALRNGMNDYKHIRLATKEYRKLRPADTAHLHRKDVSYIKSVLGNAAASGVGKIVVISHHAPTWESVAPRYRHDLLSGGYASELSDLIIDSRIVAWIHGHTHDQFDYMCGDTRVVCNPKGYPGQSQFELKYFEV